MKQKQPKKTIAKAYPDKSTICLGLEIKIIVFNTQISLSSLRGLSFKEGLNTCEIEYFISIQ